jgi:phospholipid/cholesterol/gamma-HCH transport system substrate-binding protein
VRRFLARHGVQLLAIAGLIVIAAVVGGYILVNQRLRFPWEDRYEIRAEFASAQAVTPGQGQTLTVSGVNVGEVSDVQLSDGRALVTLSVERDRLPAVFRDARMTLRPKTPLNDMTVQLDPGHARAGRLAENDVLSVARTTPNVNLDEVVAALDRDTRDYLTTFISAGGRGLRGRGADLRAVLKASAPTLRQTKRVTGAINQRRRELRRLVDGLELLTGTVADHDRSLVDLVSGSEATFSVLARRERALRASLRRLPGTLAQADATVERLRPLARELAPAARELRPAARTLGPALRGLRPLVAPGTGQLRTIRGLVRTARPPVRDLHPLLASLKQQTPDLARAVDVLDYVVNELAHNPGAPHRGYLFWLAWFAHNANSMLSVQDANGAFWRGQLITSCSTISGNRPALPLLAALYETTACPGGPK